ncbi:MAG TPA: sialate O-acetylesterase [Cyclobacteriaceae bacterium]|nr:sialate O-acetylesterase [Cyclobacteriaceae bacterium]
MLLRKLLFTCLLLFPLTLLAQLRLPAIFADHMVFQRNSKAPIWGWSHPSAEVIVKAGWNNEDVTVKASNTGAWKAVLSTPEAGGPYTVSITSGGTLTLEDVMVGEVWICSGQSNMEWSMNASADGKEDKASANFPGIRLFHVPKAGADYPQVMGEGSWKTTTPESVAGFSAVGYYFGRRLHEELDIPVGLINVSWGGTPAEVWIPEVRVTGDEALNAANKKLRESEHWPKEPGKVYNAMIHPLMPLAIAGAIWYQGESNTAAPLAYKDMMQQLIEGWRNGFNKDFPFYYVQIAPFNYGDLETGTLIREQQVKMLEIPGTGMVVVSDHVEDVKDIHPRYKKPVGERLANLALTETYGKTGIASKSPLYKSMAVEKNRIRISFDNAPNGLMSKGKEVTEFMIAGEDGKFFPARAKIDGSTVVVSSREVKKPVAVRFGWPNNSIPNLYSKEGLPVSCFRTDEWKVLGGE